VTYLDTSALVKRFVSEAGSSDVQILMTGGEPVASATIAYVELYSGLTRRHREGVLSQLQYRLACRRVERDWTALIKVELRAEILSSARGLIQRHGLRAFDAIHLASALGLQAAANEPVTFVAADQRLLRAAAGERLATVNPEAVRGRQ
jgi:predicted nucleic acid-binding protein